MTKQQVFDIFGIDDLRLLPEAIGHTEEEAGDETDDNGKEEES